MTDELKKFVFDAAPVRGELVRLEGTWQEVLGRRRYPAPVSTLLGEMMAAQLKETTMDPRKRTLLRVEVAEDESDTRGAVDALMGTKPEARFRFLQERAEFAHELDI